MKLFGTLSELTAVLLRTATGNKEVKISSQTQTGAGPVIINIPDVGDNADNMVVTDAAQTLLYKTLTSPVINTPTGIVKGDVGLGNVDNTSDATKNAAAVVLTGKTIAASSNTITGLTNSNLSGTAAITDTNLNTISTSGKVANSATTATSANTASAIVARDASNNFSAGTITAALTGNVTGNVTGTSANVTGIVATANGGTGQNSTATFPTSGVVVTESATQTLLNKTVVSSTAAITGALTLPSGTAAQRPTPTAGMTRLNTDSNSFEGYANGIWSSIGGGLNEQPVKNYLKTYAEANVAPGTVSIAASGDAITVSGGTSAFYADAGAAAIVSDASTLLRGANNYLTAVTGASTSGSVFVQFPAVTLETADAGKPISISFDTTGNTLDNDWDVVIANYDSAGLFKGLIPVAGNASSITGTASAKIPTGTSTFNGFFISTSTAGDVFALRLRRRNGSVQIRVDSLMVGNTPVRVGAAVTDSVAFTPTGSWTTNTTYTGFYRQIGGYMFGEIRLLLAGAPTSATLTVNIPNSLTIDTTKLPDQTNSATSLGNVTILDSGSAKYTGIATYNSATSLVIRNQKDNGTAVTHTNVTQAAPVTFAVNDEIHISFAVPIANWSSNVQMADRAVESYSSNSGLEGTTLGTAYTSSTYYVQGANGSLVPNITTTDTTLGFTSYKIQFDSTIQATDALNLEINAGFGWQPIEQIKGSELLVAGNQNTTRYGMSVQPDSSTTAVVYFGRGGYARGATFSAVGSPWSILFGASWRWRVRKVSSGAQVGGAISTANIVGRSDGSTVGSGYIGENKKVSVLRSVPITIGSGTDTFITGTITLTPGVWSISGAVAFETAAASTGTAGTIQYSVTNTSAHPVSDTIGVPTSGLVQYRNGAALAASTVTVFPIHSYQTIVASGSTLVIQIIATIAKTGTVTVFGSLEATRIA